MEIIPYIAIILYYLRVKKKVFIFGDPVAHSKSPAMHNAAYKKLKLSADFEYLKKQVKPEELAEAMAILRAEDTAGANITIPHKERIIEYLDIIDPQAEEIGAVNTVVNKDGKLTGYNTDGLGFLKSLKQLNNFDVKDKRVAVFGAGGAAKAIVYVLSVVGKAKNIAVADIDHSKAKFLAGNISNCKGYSINNPDFFKSVKSADLVINATPLGMSPNEDKTPLLDLSVINPGQLYSDVVYAPRETLFLKNALAKGAKVNYGYGMLLWQGVLAFNLFTGVPVENIPVKDMEKVLA